MVLDTRTLIVVSAVISALLNEARRVFEAELDLARLPAAARPA